MITDEDILFHLDEIIANEESDDEFIDDINFDIDNDGMYPIYCIYT